ncbi:MAG: type I DNA topoisomerase [Hyphomicrobiales bacterium]
MAKNLVIVESPAKAKTIEGFLGKDYLVKSSFGHVMDLSKKDLGVDIEKDFMPNYEISTDKKKVVTELKKLAKEAEVVWLASDEDREGEAIAWHLMNALKLKESNTKRIVFHEITKPAISHAIETPRAIDKNLVDAQQARRVLDRLVGFELSPLLWKKVKPSLSAGRVQSVAVRLIVEREEDIKNFKSTSAFRVIGSFFSKENQKVQIKAELNKRFSKEEEVSSFLESCVDSQFHVSNIEKKPGKKSPAAPFTTSTLQQEASRKLGFSVSRTMRIAQNLYESGKITYMRTDSVNLSETAINMASEAIVNNYGQEYLKTRQYTTKAKGAQEAHEAIRPTYMNNMEVSGTTDEQKLYELIWKRTIASQMSDAQLEKTTITIEGNNIQQSFIAKGEVVVFDGFLKVYLESSDDESSEEKKGILPKVDVSEKLGVNKIDATERFSLNPPRYTEASLVKKMEELGIGRPSTYAPTISTIQKREYVVKEDREGKPRDYQYFSLENSKISKEKRQENTGAEKAKLFPTDIGTLVNKFLLHYFQDIIDFNFTASVEKEFDEIAQGKRIWNNMIKEFYSPFHEKVVHTTETSEKFSGERLLGQDPETGKNIYARIARFGAIVQMGEADQEEKPRFAGLRKGQSLETITLEQALDLFQFPRIIGSYEDEELSVAIGRFGPYVKHKSAFFSIPKTEDPSTITQERGIELIEAKRAKDKENTVNIFQDEKGNDIKLMKGRFGPYINYKKKNYKLVKGTDPEKLNVEDCLKVIEDNKPAKKTSAKKTTTKKTAAKKTTTKKSTAKKTTSSKTTAKKAATKKTKSKE